MMTLEKWKEKGFAEAPERVVARGDEILYRCGGGFLSSTIGRWFAPMKCEGVSAAELKYNVALLGNRLLHVGTYRVRSGTEMWVGRVAQGARDLADRTATQIYIERPLGSVVHTRNVESLETKS